MGNSFTVIMPINVMLLCLRINQKVCFETCMKFSHCWTGENIFIYLFYLSIYLTTAQSIFKIISTQK